MKKIHTYKRLIHVFNNNKLIKIIDARNDKKVKVIKSNK